MTQFAAAKGTPEYDTTKSLYDGPGHGTDYYHDAFTPWDNPGLSSYYIKKDKEAIYERYNIMPSPSAASGSVAGGGERKTGIDDKNRWDAADRGGAGRPVCPGTH